MAALSSEMARTIDALPPLERIALVERILEGLDASDPVMDVLWANESEDRLDAWKAGALNAVPAEEIFPEL